jgi:hypothetical protein
MKTTYVIRDGKFVPKHEARPSDGRFFVVPDIKPFVTQDGTEISSRSALRAYEQKHGVKQVGNDWSGSSKPVWWDSLQTKDR